MAKKQLILVGNKPFSNLSLAETIDDYDFVIRVNRMTNYGLSGKKTDGVFLGMYSDFIEKYDGGEHRDVFKEASNIFSVQAVKNNEKVLDYITPEQRDGIEVVKHFYALQDVKVNSITSTVLMLHHLLNSHWKDEYEITVTGVDIDGRGDIMANGDEWKDNLHGKNGHAEEEWLKSLVEKGLIKYLRNE